jgi:ribosome-associated protein
VVKPDRSRINIPDDEVSLEFVRASGPGGQNVNKVATAVRLRFDVRGSRVLPDDVKERLLALGGRRVTSRGVLRIDAHRFRTQERNREDALSRLMELIRRASVLPKRRQRTRPSAAARKRRLDEKRRQAVRKSARRRVGEGD